MMTQSVFFAILLLISHSVQGKPDVSGGVNPPGLERISSIKNLKASLKENGVLVSWTPVKNQAVITGYEVTWTCGEDGTATVGPSASEYLIPQLSPSTPCKISVVPKSKNKNFEAKKTEITIDCPEKFELIKGSCYYSPADEYLNWEDAKQYCRNQGSTLAVFNIHDLDLVQTLASTRPSAYNWIGASYNNDLEEFIWVNGTTHQGPVPQFTDNNSFGLKRGTCFELLKRGEVGRYYCDYRSPPVCQTSFIYT